jgi:hypothetical protein
MADLNGGGAAMKKHYWNVVPSKHCQMDLPYCMENTIVGTSTASYGSTVGTKMVNLMVNTKSCTSTDGFTCTVGIGMVS